MPQHYDCFPDTGATHHVTPNLSSLTHHDTYQGTDQLHVGNGKGLPIFNIGTSFISSFSSTFKLSNFLHLPALTKSLLSVHQFCKDNSVFFEFHPSSFFVKDQATKKTLLSGLNNDGLCPFTPLSSPTLKMHLHRLLASSSRSSSSGSSPSSASPK